MHKLAVAFVSMFFLFAAPAGAAGAGDQKWLVTQLSGDARVVRPGLQPASLSVRSQLSPGDRLVTGPTGRATLVKGADYIVVAPRSELRVPTAAQPSGFTRVIQTLGTLLFKVQHTGVPHFAVDTPMLAAVVKGTTFTVTVDQQRSAIQVTQGAVQVTANDGGMSRLVEGGRTVFLNHLAPKVLLDADRPLPASPSPAATSVTVSAESSPPLAAIATLTDGLVRAEIKAPSIVTATTTVAAPAMDLIRRPATAQPAPTTATVAPAAVTTPTVVAAVSTAVSGPATTTALVTAAPAMTTAATTVPTISVPVVVVAGVGNPAATTSPVPAPAVSMPPVTTGSNSGPGSLNSGSGGLNSGSGSLGGSSTIASITTPTVTVPSVTTPVVPVTTPTVTVPSISTPSVTVPVVATVTSVLKL